MSGATGNPQWHEGPIAQNPSNTARRNLKPDKHTVESRDSLVEFSEESPNFLKEGRLQALTRQQLQAQATQTRHRRWEPPEFLYHGTVERFLPSIMEEGLIRGKRHHVHLSKDVETARKVGARRGKPVILRVDAGGMHRDGHKFLLSANGVWLTDAVPPGYLKKT